jgi:F1F0 ATPase subunit 2
MMLIDLSSNLFPSNVWASSTLALLVGMLLGAFYFAGLWWTVRQLDSNRNVAPVFLLSMLFRTAFVVLGFYVLLGNDWRQLLLGLIGFMLVRFCSTRYISGVTFIREEV